MLSVVITTRNRPNELDTLLRSLSRQTVIPSEIIVINDGSNDHTTDLYVRYPTVQFIDHASSAGLIVRRNEGFRLASGPYLLCVDDDCVLEDPGIIESILHFLQAVACEVVAWPYRDAAGDHEQPGDSPYTHAFRGCSFIISKKVFIQVGGFREFFVRQGEEEDLCIRLLEAGCPVFKGKGPCITHHESPLRNQRQIDFYGSRNLILFAFFNIPLPGFFLKVARSSVYAVYYGFKTGRPYHRLRGVFRGWLDGLRYASKCRKPVSDSTYRRFMELKRGT